MAVVEPWPVYCGPCGNVLCAQYGCQKTAPCPPPSNPNSGIAILPPGCICPPTSEQTCLNDRCPRKPWKPYTMTTTTALTPPPPKKENE